MSVFWASAPLVAPQVGVSDQSTELRRGGVDLSPLLLKHAVRAQPKLSTEVVQVWDGMGSKLLGSPKSCCFLCVPSFCFFFFCCSGGIFHFYSFQEFFFSGNRQTPRGSSRFLKRTMFENNGESTPRILRPNTQV